MKISEWFNPRNIEHIKGYRERKTTGQWPENCAKEMMELECDSGWPYNIAMKMADCWIERFIWDDKANKLCMEIMDELDEEARLEELFYNEHKEE